MQKIYDWFKREVYDWKLLLRSIPAIVTTFFVVSVVLMNTLANKEIDIPVDWIAADCGITISWLSFLAMDMITKRFGPKAAIKMSLTATGINLLVSIALNLVSRIPGNWAEFYTYESQDINSALNSTFGGTWYIVIGSTIAFVLASIVNAVLNAGIGKLLKTNNFTSYAVRSYVSTFAGQFVDNFAFALIVSHTFFGWSMIQCVTCSFIGCILELVCEVIFSPIGYKVCKKWEANDIGNDYLEYKKGNE